jgi:hypothetical protein
MSETNETPEEQARRVADSLRSSGLGRAVEDAAGRTQPQLRLVPDLHGDLLHSLNWLSEVLSGWGPDALADGEEFEDPEEAASAAVAEDAVDRIITAIRPTQTDPTRPTEERVDGKWVPVNTAPEGYAGRLLAPDGKFEFAPARLVRVAQDDIDTVVEICERILTSRGPLADVANETAESWNNSPLDENGERREGVAYARSVLGVMAVLDRTPWADENVEILVQALRHHDPNEDLVLTVPQAAAYQQWTTHTNRDLGGGPLDRYGRAGFSY